MTLVIHVSLCHSSLDSANIFYVYMPSRCSSWCRLHFGQLNMELVDDVKNKRKMHSKKSKQKKRKISGFICYENSSSADRDRLEKLVLGDASHMLRNLGVEEHLSEDENNKSPAWEDEDDLGLNRHEDPDRRRFAQTYRQPTWAKRSQEPSQKDEDDDLLLRTAGNLSIKPSYLARNILNVKRLPALNSETRNEGPIIKCVEFNPINNVALVAGLSGTASIFQVDGVANSKLASIQFERYPIRCGHFSTDGKQFIVGSYHRYFYVYDMEHGSTTKINTHHLMEQSNMKKFEMSPDGKLIAVAGTAGKIHLLSASSKEWIGNLSMNGDVTSLAFDPDGTYLYTHGNLGEVYVWDVRGRSLASKFTDEGTLVGTSLAVSEGYLATGSEWGIVNLYDRPERINSPSPKPIKTIGNLVTSVSSLKINSTQQILSMASDEKPNHIKMVHLPSHTVFSNFPSFNSQLGRVQALDFSPSSGYFACVNSKNTAFLYRLRHFGCY